MQYKSIMMPQAFLSFKLMMTNIVSMFMAKPEKWA